MDPRVTIVIANHNYGKYLKGCLESALNQDYKCHVVLVNDGCEDNSEIITNSYLESHPYIFSAINVKKAVGPSKARNFAIERTIRNTDYYAILDADDEYYPNKVSTLLKTALTSNQIGVVYGDYDILNIDTGNVVREYKKPYDKMLLNRECIVHSGALISSVALHNVIEGEDYYDSKMRTCEDYDLWMRISEKFMIAHVPQSLALVRVHQQNATNTVKNEVWQQNWRRVVEKTLERQNA